MPKPTTAHRPRNQPLSARHAAASWTCWVLTGRPLALTRPLPQVLDAPALQDDFYLNVVDWSAQNILAVGLGMCVYLWSACTSKVCARALAHAGLACARPSGARTS